MGVPRATQRRGRLTSGVIRLLPSLSRDAYVRPAFSPVDIWWRPSADHRRGIGDWCRGRADVDEIRRTHYPTRHSPIEPDPGIGASIETSCTADVSDRHLADTIQGQAIDLEETGYVVNYDGIIEDSRLSGVNAEADADIAHQPLRCVQRDRDCHARTTEVTDVTITSVEASRVLAITNPDPTRHYAASTAGLFMQTQTAARTLASYGMRVNSVSPGYVATAMATVDGGGGSPKLVACARSADPRRSTCRARGRRACGCVSSQRSGLRLHRCRSESGRRLSFNLDGPDPTGARTSCRAATGTSERIVSR